MRKDMGKCVIERARNNSGARSVKARWYGKFVEYEEGPDYDGMTHLPVSRKQEGYNKAIGNKSFTDVLGPIDGYLKSSVGRKWDDVYSELARGLGGGAWGVRHILHAHINVAAKTYRGTDGNIWYLGKYGPEKIPGGYRTEFYVEPETKILRAHPDAGKRISWQKKLTNADLWKVDAGDGKWYVRANGIWFMGRYEDSLPIPDRNHVPRSKWERVKYLEPEWPDFTERYGVVKHFIKLKSCSKKEIQALLKKRDAGPKVSRSGR